MELQLLIHPKTFEIAAKHTKNDNGEESVDVLDRWLLQGLASVGIAVPSDFANGKHYIYPTDEPKYFARAFVEEYFQHGLMQQGYYWVKAADYIGPKEEVEKAVKCMLDTIKNYI